MKSLIVDGVFQAPCYIFIRSAKTPWLAILEKVGLSQWSAVDEPISDQLLEKEHSHYFVTQVGDWLQIMDDWNYSLWFDKTFQSRLLPLSIDFDIVSFSMGDIDQSFDFKYMHRGEIVSTFVIEDPDFDGGFIMKKQGLPGDSEHRVISEKDRWKKMVMLTNIYGIQVKHNLPDIKGYWQATSDDNGFEFDERLY